MSLDGAGAAGFTLLENASLRDRNTLRVDARAGWLAEVHDANAIPDLLAHPALRGKPLLLLGRLDTPDGQSLHIEHAADF